MCFYTQQHAHQRGCKKRLNAVDDPDGFLVSRDQWICSLENTNHS
jgi:hypothetical protein